MASPDCVVFSLADADNYYAGGNLRPGADTQNLFLNLWFWHTTVTQPAKETSWNSNYLTQRFESDAELKKRELV
jgi:hypothetical protein